MGGFVLATSGVADDKAQIERLKKEIEALKAKQEVIRLRQELADLKKGPIVEIDQIKIVDGTAYFKEEKEPFICTAIEYYEDGSKLSETPYVDGERHGTEVWYKKTDRNFMNCRRKTAKRSPRRNSNSPQSRSTWLRPGCPWLRLQHLSNNSSKAQRPPL